MNIKKTAKKIVAIGAGVGMVGATLMGALAQDLNEFPQNMISGGQFDGKIVVGANAAAEDILGSIDVAAGLQAASTTTVETGGSSETVVTGDAVQIEDSGDILEIGESIGIVTETLTDDDLEMLEGGRITTSSGSTDFNQILELNGAPVTSSLVGLFEDHDDEIGYFLFFNDGDEFFHYELEFTSGLESDIDGTSAEDLEDESIFMLGQYYSIVSATTDGAATLTLELIAGDVVDTLTEGETKTYTVDGKDYEVTVLVIGQSNNDQQVKFLVNGEVTDSMEISDTDTLSDGLEIGVREVIETTAYRESDPGSVVEFYLGANKLTFEDTNVSATGTGGSVEINRENIEDATMDLAATFPGGDLRLNRIEYSLDVDADKNTDIYVGDGEGIREYLDEPEGMLNAGWDITFEGVTMPSTTDIRFDAVDDDEYELSFTNRRGDEFSVPYAFTTTGGTVNFGDEDDTFIFIENDTNGGGANATADYAIDLDDYFLLTDIGGTGVADNADDSYVLQFSDVDEDDSTVSFEHVGSGNEVVATYTGTVGTDPESPVTGEVTIGGTNFDFWMYEPTAGDYRLAVDLDNSGAFATNIVEVVVQGGGVLSLADAPAGPAWTASLTTEDEDVDSDKAQVVTMAFSSGGTPAELDIGTITNTSGTFYSESDNDVDLEYSVTGYGAWFEVSEDDNGADSLTISYPQQQVEALVYVVGGDVQRSVVGGDGNAQVINVLPVGIAVLDTDISVDDDNLIVIGGPCANSVAAELLGNPADCAEGFTPGMGMVRIWDTGDNHAILAAGFSAGDTVATAQVVAQAASGEVDGFEGESVEVVVAGANDVTVRSAMS